MCMCIGCDPEVEYTVNIWYIDSYTVSMINYQQAYKYPKSKVYIAKNGLLSSNVASNDKPTDDSRHS